MAKFEVRVYEDHYVVVKPDGDVTVAEDNSQLLEILEQKPTEKKRTYPKGVRRQRKVKPEPEAAAQ